MKKVVLVDGNNLMFRSFFATSYTGNIMRNSEGFPTNALYGFVNMLNKIITEEKPQYMAVAFDVGKNFRKKEYKFYKEGRSEIPEELKVQMPYARKILDGMGIKYLELEPYEADDIIGTLVKMAEDDKEYYSTIISSDKDLLQLINFETEVKLLKKDSYIRYNEKNFNEEFGIDPIKMIDLKSLMGDASDNIPGVKGVGEKTALKLLQENGSLDGVYENIENIKGALKDKLVSDKENAYISKKLATIYKEVPLEITFEELRYYGCNSLLAELYKELGFNSLLKKLDIKEEINFDFIKVEDINSINLIDDISLYVETDNENYHHANVLGIAITDKNNTYYFKESISRDVLKLIGDKNIVTYDIKKHLNFFDVKYQDDVMIGLFLLNKVVKDDISSIMLDLGIDAQSNASLKKNKYEEELLSLSAALKSKFIYEIKSKMKMDLKEIGLHELYSMIEVPLASILYSMEKEGVVCDLKELESLKSSVKTRLTKLDEEIQTLAGVEFNVSSPKQLGEILFEKLDIAKGKKNKTGYKTDASTLEKLVGEHPIIEKILEFRNLSKLYSTYIEGLESNVNNGIINPLFKQTLARTGRLSCAEPNLQNIPVKDELGKMIRKAFKPKYDLLLSADYSQIELRILAHISKDETLITAFNNDADIHRKVAADIYGINESDVTKEQRKTAKAVIFGIVYGISGFGLGDNLNISREDASTFIKKYYDLYPRVKMYMDKIISEAKSTGVVKTLFNRVRVIEEITSSNFMIRQMGERMALNTPIQGTSADIIKIAMINIYNEFNKLNIKSKMILQVHDELIFDVYQDELEDVTRIVKEKMEEVVKLSVPLKVETSSALSWYEV